MKARRGCLSAVTCMHAHIHLILQLFFSDSDSFPIIPTGSFQTPPDIETLSLVSLRCVVETSFTSHTAVCLNKSTRMHSSIKTSPVRSNTLNTYTTNSVMKAARRVQVSAEKKKSILAPLLFSSPCYCRVWSPAKPFITSTDLFC